MKRAVFLSFAITAFSAFSYGQSYTDFSMIGEGSLKIKKRTDTPKSPPPIGDKEDDTIGVMLFPNPSNGIFFIDVEKLGAQNEIPVTIRVIKFNSSRHVIYTSKGVGPFTKKIDISKFGRGRYLLIVSAPRTSIRRHLIVE